MNDPRLGPIAGLLHLNRRLAANCFDGVSEAQAAGRPVTGCNSMSFVLAHMIDARHLLLRVAGGSAPNPVGDLPDAKTLDELPALPPAADLLDGWHALAGAIEEYLPHVSGAHLEAPSTQPFPGGGTALDAIAFFTQHDSYHLGQLALLRRAHGLPAMSYR